MMLSVLTVWSVFSFFLKYRLIMSYDHVNTINVSNYQVLPYSYSKHKSSN